MYSHILLLPPGSEDARRKLCLKRQEKERDENRRKGQKGHESATQELKETFEILL